MDSFIFVSCQIGMEKPLKADIGKQHPELRFAFSRPGFVTFKDHHTNRRQAIQQLRSPFARMVASSVGSVSEPAKELRRLIERLPAHSYRHIHVWERDRSIPGERKFEPFATESSLELGKQIRSCAADTPLGEAAINRSAKSGDHVADFILVEPDLLFGGWHKASNPPSRWPGGVPPLRPNENMISRAYLKMQEALRWSQLPIVTGDLCVELGSSPGGACQALLERGLRVIGVDPAKMDERVMQHPDFTHVQARAADLKRKEFADVRWLMMDANIAPENTLEAVEHIVTNRRVNIHGLLMTLKLLNDELPAKIDEYVERVRGWGYRHVRTRQLAFNRREICLMAAKSKAKIRLGRNRKHRKP